VQREGRSPAAGECGGMPRFCALAFATLLLALPVPAFAEVSTGGSSSGGTRVSPADTQGGVDASSSGGAAAPAVASLSGAPPIAGEASLSGGEAPPATVAQEPALEPEGQGEQQPAEPRGEPQPATGAQPAADQRVELAGAQAAAGGGGLPRSGLEAFKLVLLGFVLLLVGARVRVVAKARGARLRRQGYFAATADEQPRLAPDGLPEAAPLPSSFAPPVDEYEEPEPQPAGLLPSTATAKRKAGELSRHDDHRGA
jgi:hypothetical protein